MKNSQGFSLIEVLVTIVLTIVGILGMVALQSKSIQYTQDAVNRNAAVTLTNDLIEIIRMHRHDLFEKKPPRYYFYAVVVPSSSIYDADGKLTLNPSGCPKSAVAQTLLEQSNCWLKRVQETLPDANALLDSHFVLCPSYKTDEDSDKPACADSSYEGSMLAIQVAWRSKEKVCGPALNSDVCTLTTRVEL